MIVRRAFHLGPVHTYPFCLLFQKNRRPHVAVLNHFSPSTRASVVQTVVVTAIVTANGTILDGSMRIYWHLSPWRHRFHQSTVTRVQQDGVFNTLESAFQKMRFRWPFSLARYVWTVGQTGEKQSVFRQKRICVFGILKLRECKLMELSQ